MKASSYSTLRMKLCSAISNNMQYLALRELEDVTSALNFETPDCHVIGGCDIYTTKAAGSDKKLYKSIENSLKTQYEQVVKLSISLSLPQSESLAESLNLSRSSPFGPLSQISSRRTFAYLIATLNASHPDYDFSHILRPSDFLKRRSLRTVLNSIDATLYNLRPRLPHASVPLTNKGKLSNVSQTPGGVVTWGPRMWRLIDEQMDLKNCSLYSYVPEEDPFEGEEGAIWSMNHFFFNKDRKRVCYLYLRGLSVLSHSPVARASQLTHRRNLISPVTGSMKGANKRAHYWLGDQIHGKHIESGFDDEDDDDDDMTIVDARNDEVDADEDYDIRDEHADELLWSSDDDDMESGYDTDDVSKSIPRAMSEQVADLMEI